MSSPSICVIYIGNKSSHLDMEQDTKLLVKLEETLKELDYNDKLTQALLD